MFSVQALSKEFTFKAIRSSGSGGQHVNKVSSKVELSFNVSGSSVLSEKQKQRIVDKLGRKLGKDTTLTLQCGTSRSQYKNKSMVIKRAIDLLKSALVVQKKRVPTKIPKAIIKKRIKNKRFQSERKKNRQKPNLD